MTVIIRGSNKSGTSKRGTHIKMTSINPYVKLNKKTTMSYSITSNGVSDYFRLNSTDYMTYQYSTSGYPYTTYLKIYTLYASNGVFTTTTLAKTYSDLDGNNFYNGIFIYSNKVYLFYETKIIVLDYSLNIYKTVDFIPDERIWSMGCYYGSKVYFRSLKGIYEFSMPSYTFTNRFTTSTNMSSRSEPVLTYSEDLCYFDNSNSYTKLYLVSTNTTSTLLYQIVNGDINDSISIHQYKINNKIYIIGYLCNNDSAENVYMLNTINYKNIEFTKYIDEISIGSSNTYNNFIFISNKIYGFDRYNGLYVFDLYKAEYIFKIYKDYIIYSNQAISNSSLTRFTVSGSSIYAYNVTATTSVSTTADYFTIVDNYGNIMYQKDDNGIIYDPIKNSVHS